MCPGLSSGSYSLVFSCLTVYLVCVDPPSFRTPSPGGPNSIFQLVTEFFRASVCASSVHVGGVYIVHVGVDSGVSLSCIPSLFFYRLVFPCLYGFQGGHEGWCRHGLVDECSCQFEVYLFDCPSSAV